MTTLEQITCRGCSEVFHKPTIPEKRVGVAGRFDYEKTCPVCGTKNAVAVASINATRTTGTGFIEAAMAKAMSNAMGSLHEKALRNSTIRIRRPTKGTGHNE